MRSSKIAGFTWIVALSACRAETAMAPSGAAPQTAPAPPTVAPPPPPTSPSPAAADSAAPASAGPPTCVAMGHPCQINDTYCCYGSCRVYNGSATPVCAP